MVASLREDKNPHLFHSLILLIKADHMTDSLSPLESAQTKSPLVSSSEPLLRQNLDFRPTSPISTPLQINVGDIIAVKAEDTSDLTLARRLKHKVIGRSQEGDLIVIEDARRKSGNGYEFKYILNLSSLRELTIKQKNHFTDGEEVFQRMPGLHNFRLCPELRVLSIDEVALA
jgi:hypothetical protein